jgi:nicotinamidase-related amidase
MSDAANELPVPPFYDPENARRWSYRPDPQALFEEAGRWRARHAIPASGTDRRNVHLLLVDLQKDFCFPEGSLYVGGRSGRGAMDDNDRIARFVYRNLARLTEITCTLDTHYPFQIFSPSFWLDREGAPLTAHREITTDDIRSGRVRPNPAIAWWVAEGRDLGWLGRQVEFYCAELERSGKYTLYLWPPHCLLGGEGHVLAGVVQEARLFHAYARGSRDGTEIKGGHPLTENYSVLAPEVRRRHDGGPLAERNSTFLETLLAADRLVIAGQAASHCVKSSVEDLLDAIRARDASLARKVYLLRDGMSSVAVADPARPGAFLFDFTPQSEAALARFSEAGMHVVSSTEPMASWPGME